MLVIDKPAGIAVHRGPKGGENLEDYFHALRFGLPRNPALAHRLDRETSGCLVLGRRGKRRVPCEWNGRAEPGAWKRRVEMRRFVPPGLPKRGLRRATI